MALSNPLTLAQLMDFTGGLEYGPWECSKGEEVSESGGGELLTRRLRPDLWECVCRTRELENEDAEAVKARLAYIGSSRTAYFCNPAKQYPRLDPTGAIYGSSTPQVASIASGREAVAIKGLPPAYVLKTGDFLHIVYGTTRRALLQVVEDVTADGSGTTAQFLVTPALRPDIAVDDSVAFIRPAAKVKIVPMSVKSETVSPVSMRVSFTVRQTLGA